MSAEVVDQESRRLAEGIRGSTAPVQLQLNNATLLPVNSISEITRQPSSDSALNG